MAVDFNKTFGAGSNNVQSGTKEKQPAAQFWLNIGYDSGIADDSGQNRFVSLPLGIPLDGQQPLKTNSSNHEFAQFNAARNDLHEQIMAVAKTLKPGEAKTLNLQTQLRRVNEELAPATSADNAFVQKLALVA